MNDAAKKQLEPVSMDQVRAILQKKSQLEFDKMLIDGNQPVKRCNFVFIKLKYQTADRALKKLNFPIFSTIKQSFIELRSVGAEGGEKVAAPSARLFEGLEKEYQVIGQPMSSAEINNAFEFPFDVGNGELYPQQSRYFFPAHTVQQACKTCNSRKYVTCPNTECGGRHKYSCPKCEGKGRNDCKTCDKTGQIKCKACDGRGEYKCAKCEGGRIKCVGCNGAGIVKQGNTQENCARCSGRGYNICFDCKDGIVRCPKCEAKGQVVCTDCAGKGYIDCSYCSTTGVIECKQCYADKERYGMVDCPDCKATGFLGQVVYVETTVKDQVHETLLPLGDTIKINTDRLDSHINKNGMGSVVYKKLNDAPQDNYDEYSKGYADTLEKNLGLNKSGFPLLTREELFYQVVPCVELSYKHIVTNTVHEFAIIDFWDNPEVIFYTDAEKLKQSVKNIIKTVGGFFSKLFKTKGYFTKEDNRNEIFLLIYLAKVDDRIVEEEKQYLSENINNLQELTNSQRRKLFELLNATSLPELTKYDVAFSTKEKAKEVLENLNELANIDREVAPREAALIERIKAMIAQG